MPTKKPKAAKPKPRSKTRPKIIPPIPYIPTTHVSLVLDESGSMESRRDRTVRGVNTYITSLGNNGRGSKIRFGLTKFNTESRVLRSPMDLTLDPWGCLSHEILLGEEDYIPKGGTALYDAIGDAINNLMESSMSPIMDRAVVVIMTDGHENSSKRFTKSSIEALIRSKQAQGNWTFVFLGASLDSFDVGASLGIPKGNILKINIDSVELNFNALSKSTICCAMSSVLKTDSFSSMERGAWAKAGAETSPPTSN